MTGSSPGSDLKVIKSAAGNFFAPRRLCAPAQALPNVMGPTRIVRQNHASRSLPSSQHACLSSVRSSAKLNGSCVLRSPYSRSLCRSRMPCVYCHILKYKNEKSLGSQQFYLARAWTASRVDSARSSSHRPAPIECPQIHPCLSRRNYRQSGQAMARKPPAMRILLHV